jgi:NTE family protein
MVEDAADEPGEASPAVGAPAPRLGLALGAGAARGLSHIGVLRELEALELRPGVLAGSSIGAVVAVAWAAGRLDALEARMRAITWFQTAQFVRFGFRGGLIEPSRLRGFLADILGPAELQDLPARVAVTAADLESGRAVWITEGPAVDAVCASVAMPGLLEPVRRGASWLVDGAIVDPLPVAPLRAQGADLVIGVNLSGPLWRDSAPLRRERALAAAAVRADRNEMAVEPSAPGALETVFQSVTVMQDLIARVRLAADPCEILLTPDVRGFGLFQFDKADQLIAAGRACVHAQAERLAALRAPA